MYHQTPWINALISIAENAPADKAPRLFYTDLLKVIAAQTPNQEDILICQKAMGEYLLKRIKSKKETDKREHRLLELICGLSSNLDDPDLRDVVDVFAEIIDHGLSEGNTTIAHAAFAALNAAYFDKNQDQPEFVEQTAYALVPLRKVLTRQKYKKQLSSARMVMLGRSFGRLLCRDNYAKHILTSDNRHAVATVMAVALTGFNDPKKHTIDNDVFDFVETLLQENTVAGEGFSMWGHPFLEAIKNHEDNQRIADFIEVFGQTVLSQNTPSGQPENVLLIGNRHNDYMAFNADNAVPKALECYAKNNAEHIHAVLNMAIGDIQAQARIIDWKSTHRPTLKRQNLENYFKTVRILIDAVEELPKSQLMLEALSNFDDWLNQDENKIVKRESRLNFLSQKLTGLIEDKVSISVQRAIPRKRVQKSKTPQL